jgi:lipid-A-disaccharide synthase
VSGARDPALKLAIIAGEPSGDRLGADLIAALRARHAAGLTLTGIGGDAMEEEGLVSLFDHSELSIVGISAVLARLPQLIRRIGQSSDAIIAARPDVLFIIDSPDFTHRVARKVRRAMPDLPIVNYVSPSVWAWKPERAARMRAYVDHVLAILPFEPQVLAELGGPPTTYIGHRLVQDRGLLSAQSRQKARRERETGAPRTCLLLPGSRRSELSRLLPVFRDAAIELGHRDPGLRFVIPAVSRHAPMIAEAVADWPVRAEVVTGEAAKWQAFGEADGALAASGTVLLELALAGVPCISAYRLDPVARLLIGKIVAWSAALPNLIAGYPVIPEYFNESARGARLARHVERLMQATGERQAMLDGFDVVREAMRVDRAPGDLAAEIVLAHAIGGRNPPALTAV